MHPSPHHLVALAMQLRDLVQYADEHAEHLIAALLSQVEEHVASRLDKEGDSE